MTVQDAIAASPPPPARARAMTASRAIGYALCAMWSLLFVYLVWSLIGSLDQEVFERYVPRLLLGLWVTVQIVLLSLGLGLLLSLPVALSRLSRLRILNALSFGYVYFFRGTPLLAQLFLVYYGAGQLRPELEQWHLWWFFRDAYNCVILTFALNTAAYQAEIFRVAIRSVPRGQHEAGMALGLSGRVIFWKVVMPQAMITALRPLGNEVILMIKGSALASVVTIFDLMGATKLAYSRTFNFDVYLWAAVIYLAMVETLRFLWDRAERRLTQHLGHG